MPCVTSAIHFSLFTFHFLLYELIHHLAFCARNWHFLRHHAALVWHLFCARAIFGGLVLVCAPQTNGLHAKSVRVAAHLSFCGDFCWRAAGALPLLRTKLLPCTPSRNNSARHYFERWQLAILWLSRFCEPRRSGRCGVGAVAFLSAKQGEFLAAIRFVGHRHHVGGFAHSRGQSVQFRDCRRANRCAVGVRLSALRRHSAPPRANLRSDILPYAVRRHRRVVHASSPARWIFSRSDNAFGGHFPFRHRVSERGARAFRAQHGPRHGTMAQSAADCPWRAGADFKEK